MQNDTAMHQSQRRSSRWGKAFIVALFLLGSTLGLYGQGSVSPPPILTFFTNAGAPCANCLLYTYVAGSVNTDLATYSNEGLTTELPNPISINSAGRPTTAAGATTVVYLSQSSYKFVLTTSGGTTIWSADNVPAIPAQAAALDVEGTAGENLLAGEAVYLTDGSGGQTAGRWYKTDADNTYGSTTAGMVGVVPGNIDSGESGSIRLQGRITGLSALTAGAKYYASATAGGLTATPPTNARFIGEADSTTSIVVGGNPGAVRLPDSNGTHAAVMRITQNLTADRLWTVTWGDAAITTTFTPGASGTFLRTDGTNWAASTLVLPNAATTGDLPYASATSTVSMLNSGATAGMYLRNGGASTAPLWSTLVLPNAATATYIPYATSSNTWGESAALAYTGSALAVTGNLSLAGATPNVTAVTAGSSLSIEAGTAGILSATIYNDTNAGAANLYIDGSVGQIFRSTSSARYKANIAPLGSWRWFLDLQPVRFNSLNAPTGRTFGGFLAEDVAALSPRGADGRPLFAGLDQQGRPDDVAYPHLVAVAQQGLVEHEDRLNKQLDLIAGIEARLRALEAENAALRAQLGAGVVSVPAAVGGRP